MSITAKEAIQILDDLLNALTPNCKRRVLSEANTLFLYLEHRQRVETNEPPVTS